MPRPKKGETPRQPANVAPAPMVPMAMQPVPAQLPQIQQQPLAPEPGTGQTPRISYTEFIRVRDSVHARFNTITGLMKSFSDDFLRQTNLLIGEPAPFDNGTSNSMQNLIANLDSINGQFGELGAHIEEKKERKKRTHDPNAPKRPLTPYFLYMQTARPIIANDLGQDAPKGAVQEEGQRRWASMTKDEKDAWNNAYQFNLRLYNARVHSYKAGNVEARNMTDADALTYADTNGIPQPVLSGDAYAPNDQDAIAEQLAMAIAPPAEVETQTPKAKVTRKRKSAAADVEDAEASAAKTSTPASPDKKRKRASKVAETPDEPKKSSRKKKAA
ncbi:hypothetical protein F4806DRAFT_475547 [Annulohypoxylon nitens]|nr:hypothetical protein F4806DRAFT_475547 [Annulohypoxylon nitens]KAI1440720.1 hypothetical protein F5Y02DRAFT_401910 [Annulohypoxylon stygium]